MDAQMPQTPTIFHLLFASCSLFYVRRKVGCDNRQPCFRCRKEGRLGRGVHVKPEAETGQEAWPKERGDQSELINNNGISLRSYVDVEKKKHYDLDVVRLANGPVLLLV